MYSDTVTYDMDLVHPDFSYYGPPLEERDHRQYPTPAHFDPYVRDSYPMTLVSSLDPGGIFGPQTQYLPQQVLAQTTSHPIGSGAPCFNPTPPGSSCAPSLHPLHPLHRAYSSAPFTALPHDPWVRFSVQPRRVDIQPHPLSVSVIGPGGHVQSPRTAPKRRRNKTSTAPANAHPRPSKPKPLVQWLCPVSGCGVPSRRPQERDRHLLSHLPCSIACSIGPCLWRGERVDTFKKHLCKKHRINEPDGHGYWLYDTRPLVVGIVKGSISIEGATQVATEKVKEMSLRIGKPEFLEDPSGPKRKKGSHL